MIDDSRAFREYVAEMLDELGYAETVVTLMFENETLTQEDAEYIVDDVADERDMIDIPYDEDEED